MPSPPRPRHPTAATLPPPARSELVKALEDLREQREEVNRGILRDEEEKVRWEGGPCVRRREGHARGAQPLRRHCRFAPMSHRPQARIQKELTALTERLGRLNEVRCDLLIRSLGCLRAAAARRRYSFTRAFSPRALSRRT